MLRVVAACAAALLVPAAAAQAACTPTFSASGADPAAIASTVASFEAALGGANNGAVAGTHDSGFRRINWDGVPDALAEPNQLPRDFFNATSPRGVIFDSPASTPAFSVSAKDDFASLTASYDTSFQTFSAPRLFRAIAS